MIKKFLKQSWDEGNNIGNSNILSAIFIGAPSHIFLYFLYKYITPLPYESLGLRLFSAFLCVSTYSYKYLPEKIKTLYFPFYWHLMLIGALVFNSTFLLLKNNFNEIYLYWEIIVVFLLILLVANWFIFLIDLAISIGAAYLLFVVTTPVINLNPEFNVVGYSVILLFTTLLGMVFIYTNRSTWLSKQKKQLKIISDALAGTITHEIRNPLNIINLAASASTQVLKSDQKDKVVEALKYNDNIFASIAQANDIINIVLADLKEEPVKSADFSLLSTDKILPEIVGKFGYSNKEQRSKVKIDLRDNFIFRAIPERFTFIMYNLLKNALYYLKDYPDSVVTVGAESRNINGSEYDVIYVHDTGPGIPPEIIPKLFGSFFTSGKKEGTGLGLSFCKRNMKIFDGDIIVESEVGQNGKNGWTKFSLLFPKLTEDQIQLAQQNFRKKRMLFVDDQKTNLLMVKSKIENAFPDIICDIADNGFKAIEMAKEHDYHLILMDIQMPNMDGIVLTGEIRNIDNEVPVVAFTSLDKKDFLKETGKNSVVESDFNYFLNKPSTDNFLYRTVTKWLIDLEDDFSYLGNKEEYLKILKGKKVLLADDQETNLMMTKILLEKTYGMIVVKALDGKELLEIYKKSLDENGQTDFDIILTDINMPPHNGDEAAKEIRNIESKNNISHKNEIPIIALSGEGQRKEIHHFFDCQMTDYFIKGKNADILFKMIAHYVTKQDEQNDDLAKENQQNPILEKPKAQKNEEKEGSKNNLKPEDFNTKFKTFDPNYFRHFNQEETHEILSLFLKNNTESMSKIKESAGKNDMAELLLKIHTIKGASGIIGTERLHNYLVMIEPMLKNTENVSEKDNWLTELEIIYDESEAEIKKVLGK